MADAGLDLCIVANVQWPRFGANAGGFVHVCEVARILARSSTVLTIVPNFVAAECRRRFPTSRFATTPVPARFARSTLAVQAFSIVNWIVHIRTIRRSRALLLASHFLGDVLPAVFANRPSVVIVHHLVAPPWKRAGNPMANAVHYAAERFSIALARRVCTVVVTSSNLVRDELRRYGFRQPIVVTVNASSGVPTALPTRPSQPSERVVFLGRLTPTKNLEALVATWPYVIERRPKATLEIVGGGDAPYVDGMRRRVAAAGIATSVSFHGNVDDRAKWSLLASAAVFAFPSLEEGFGIALVEAMTLGIPCVTFDLPIFGELFPEGRIEARRDDPFDLARAIVRVLADPSDARRIGERGREYATRYTWEHAASFDGEALDRAAAAFATSSSRRCPKWRSSDRPS